MNKILVFLFPFFMGVFQVPLLIGGEVITGKGCYRFSDQESISVAREIALSMAKRDALEGYAVFVNATATVDNYVLKNSIISSVSASVLNNMKITSKKENLEKREVCREISAVVEEIEVKKEITSRIRLSQKKKNINFETGLHEDRKIKILKIKRKKYKNGDSIEMRGLCRQWGVMTSPEFEIMYYDEDGIPLYQIQKKFICKRKNYIAWASFLLPGYASELEPLIKEAVDYTIEWIK
jgi:hypothetical protein